MRPETFLESLPIWLQFPLYTTIIFAFIIAVGWLVTKPFR